MTSMVEPDQYLPGAASLIEQLDTKILIILRDKRHLIGILRSFDQYMNLVLEETIERITYQDKFCDAPLGLFLVRGDSIIILGEIDIEKERALEINKVEPEVMAELLSKSQSEKDEWDFD